MAATLTPVATLDAHDGAAWGVAWSPDGDLLASCGADRAIRLWTYNADTHALAPAATLDGAAARTVRRVAFAPAPPLRLAAASFDGATTVWTPDGVGGWDPAATLAGHESEVKGVAWAPRGDAVATCGRDRAVWVWDALPGGEYECADVKAGHSQDVKSVAWEAEGDAKGRVASASYDGDARVWAEPAAGDGDWECVGVLRAAHGGATVWGVAWGKGGRIATAGGDGTVRVWRPAPGAPADGDWVLAATSAGGGHAGGAPAYDLDWEEGGYIASGGGDDAVRVWAPPPPAGDGDGNDSEATHMPLVAAARPDPACEVNCVRWRPGGARVLAAACDDGRVRVWRLE